MSTDLVNATLFALTPQICTFRSRINSLTFCTHGLITSSTPSGEPSCSAQSSLGYRKACCERSVEGVASTIRQSAARRRFGTLLGAGAGLAKLLRGLGQPVFTVVGEFEVQHGEAAN
jgi:hypothetical protein